jgi:hypothetical protein
MGGPRRKKALFRCKYRHLAIIAEYLKGSVRFNMQGDSNAPTDSFAD